MNTSTRRELAAWLRAGALVAVVVGTTVALVLAGLSTI